MKTLHIELGERSYDIKIAPGLLNRAGEEIRAVCPRARRLAVVTDSNVNPLYGETVRTALETAGFEVALFEIPAGEKSKNGERLVWLWESFMDFGLTRTDAVVALGGGVVGDLTGFAAATTLRGVDFVQIPTTLLAQVDSSVGGKVAIDLNAGKNLAGTFWQPKLVLMDPDTLKTLPDETFSDGMAEVIKYGCIADRGFFDFLAAHPARAAVMENIESVLYTCCDIKRSVVEKDERDTGKRMMLNFGHTIGHAYELAGHYEKWTHGQAVAAGMMAALKLGAALGITPAELAPRVETVLRAYGLPTAISCGGETYAAAIGRDKKGTGVDITLVLLDNLGHAVLHKLPKAELMERLTQMGGETV